MKRSTYIFAILMFSGIAAPAQSMPEAKPVKSMAQRPAPAHAPADAGERAFAANCSRCHNPPEQIHPRITGTVVRHMRVRATLSADDERALLRLFNP